MTDSLDQALSERFALQHDELPMPDFADVLRRATRISTPPLPRKRPRYHRRFGGVRPVLAAALVVGVLAGAGVGIAAGFGAFEGTPAPPDVSTNFKQLNGFATAAVQKGFSLTFPQTDVSKAHGVVEIETPDGPEDLWAAPNSQGGQCYLIDWANDPTLQDGTKYGFNGCEQSPPPASNISISDVWVAGHPDLMTVYGSVYVPAATVQITLDDGSTATLPVIEDLFLGSLPKGTKLGKVVALDASGNQVAEMALRSD
jgi:hypothetical protein